MLFWDTAVNEIDKTPCLHRAHVSSGGDRSKISDIKYIGCYAGIRTTEKNKTVNGDSKCWEVVISGRGQGQASLTE